MQRRVNDAQVERLIRAMRSSVAYRQELAKRVASSKATPGTKEYKTAYNSAMRRFQRYVTDSGEKRSFARAPVTYQRATRQIAREVPYREAYTPKKPLPRPLTERPFDLRPPAPGPSLFRDEDDEDEDEDEDESEYEREHEGEIDVNDLRSVVAFYDGNSSEAAKALGINANEQRLLDLATTGEGLNVFGLRGGEGVAAAVREWLETADEDDYQDTQDFHDLLMNMPEWEVGMILEHLSSGQSTFADWLDKWRDYGMDYEALLTDSEWWELWREAYEAVPA